jgi:signal transduction histidine kinase
VHPVHGTEGEVARNEGSRDDEDQRMELSLARAAAGFALVTGIVVAVVVGSAWFAHRSGETRARLLVSYADDLTTASRSQVAAETMIAAGRGYLLTREPALLDRVRTAEAELDAALHALAPRARSPFERDLLVQVKGAAAQYLELLERSLSDPALARAPTAVAALFRTGLLPARAELEARTQKLVTEKVRLQNQGRAALRMTARRAFAALIGLGAAGTLLALSLAFFFTRRLRQLYLRERRAAERARLAATAARDLVAAVAHDLRNPLSAILMNAAQLMKETAGTKARGHAVAVDRIASRMERFIGELLDAAIIEAGMFSVAQQDCPVVELVARTVDEFRDAATDKHIALRWQVDDVRTVWADPLRLAEALANLVGNAIKFTPTHGTVELRVTGIGPSTRFEVRDTGPGIAVSDTPHLFDRYWKGRSGGRKSVGLGLYIVKGIIEGHGGEIWVDSAVGRGTTFVFTIPARSAAERSHGVTRMVSASRAGQRTAAAGISGASVPPPH